MQGSTSSTNNLEQERNCWRFIRFTQQKLFESKSHQNHCTKVKQNSHVNTRCQENFRNSTAPSLLRRISKACTNLIFLRQLGGSRISGNLLGTACEICIVPITNGSISKFGLNVESTNMNFEMISCWWALFHGHPWLWNPPEPVAQLWFKVGLILQQGLF